MSKCAIIFENESAVVAIKPAGVLSVQPHPNPNENRLILPHLLKQQLRLVHIYPVHRLDYEVSGLMLFAKTKEFHRAANSWFEKALIEKKYLAFTQPHASPLDDKALQSSKQKKREYQYLEIPHVGPARWTFRSHLSEGKKRTFSAPYGKLSITVAEVVNRSEHWLQWLIKPQTGRRHQIRYELSSRGFPIIGDTLYGSLVLFDQNLQQEFILKIQLPINDNSNKSLKKEDLLSNSMAIALCAVELNLVNCPDFKSFGLPENFLITTA